MLMLGLIPFFFSYFLSRISIWLYTYNTFLGQVKYLYNFFISKILVNIENPYKICIRYLLFYTDWVHNYYSQWKIFVNTYVSYHPLSLADKLHTQMKQRNQKMKPKILVSPILFYFFPFSSDNKDHVNY